MIRYDIVCIWAYKKVATLILIPTRITLRDKIFLLDIKVHLLTFKNCNIDYIDYFFAI